MTSQDKIASVTLFWLSRVILVHCFTKRDKVWFKKVQRLQKINLNYIWVNSSIVLTLLVLNWGKKLACVALDNVKNKGTFTLCVSACLFVSWLLINCISLHAFTCAFGPTCTLVLPDQSPILFCDNDQPALCRKQRLCLPDLLGSVTNKW